MRLLPIPMAVAAVLCAQEADVVFRSDVALMRVDAQVVDRDNRAITGLRLEDFIVREDGKQRDIRNFASENVPIDVVLLFDVSASMRPHVQHIASAAHEALRVLRDEDRVSIMVFDRSTRTRMPFRSGRNEVERELQSLLDHETFRGGTDITRGLLDAASYVERAARRDARRAIVILTDDQTERSRDEAAVSRALERADAVLSALIAPDAMQNRRQPGIGPGSPGGPLGGIILGRRGPYGGNRRNGPVATGPRTKSAGTSEIARSSGGDSMSVYDASSLETTLSRIRQRYALYFYRPDAVKAGQERTIQVDLADEARRRYRDAEVRYRRVYLGAGSSVNNEPTMITRAPAGGSRTRTGDPAPSASETSARRRRSVDDVPSASRRGPLDVSGDQGEWRKADPPPAEKSTDGEKPGGWRRAEPADKPENHDTPDRRN